MTLDEKHRKILYELMEAREDLGLKLRELDTIGISRPTFESVVYNRHSASLVTVMRIAESLGMEIVIRRKPEYEQIKNDICRSRQRKPGGKQ